MPRRSRALEADGHPAIRRGEDRKPLQNRRVVPMYTPMDATIVYGGKPEQVGEPSTLPADRLLGAFDGLPDADRRGP
jgi:hypothetical protein